MITPSDARELQLPTNAAPNPALEVDVTDEETRDGRTDAHSFAMGAVDRDRRYTSGYVDPMAEEDRGTNAKSGGMKEVISRMRIFRPACVPLIVVAVFVAMVVFFPIADERSRGRPWIRTGECTDQCSLQLVESIPMNLTFNGSIDHMSTYDAWTYLLNSARHTADMTSFYWSLRGNDTYVDPSDWQGEDIYRLMATVGSKISIRIAQNKGDPATMLESKQLQERGLASVRTVDFKRLFGSGVLHTKLWTVDKDKFYIGSANMDWRSLTQVKELGALVTNCTCLTAEAQKLFDVYYMMGKPSSRLPTKWPPSLGTQFNAANPMKISFNGIKQTVYMSSSPPAFAPMGREQDLSAIVTSMNLAKKFIHVAVMDYSPSMVFTPVKSYWPYLDDAMRSAAFRGVHVKLLFSHWRHTYKEMYSWLDSLAAITGALDGKYGSKGSIEVKLFTVPSFTHDQEQIPYARVNHNKYMVTENIAYIGTSNWAGDYFVTTGGAGLVIGHDFNATEPEFNQTVAYQLEQVFMRDWESSYARDLY